MSEALPPLTRDQKVRLLRIARETVFNWVSRNRVPPLDVEDDRLMARQGVFVSLHNATELRGCIGTFHPDKPLAEAVQEMAVGAATRDPRFGPLQTSEVPRTEFELSVLGPLEPMLAEDVEPGRHGLLIASGRRRGTLLPQVATQQGWDREEFLAQTCLKAGLDRDAWKQPDVRIEAFVADVFSESDMRNPA